MNRLILPTHCFMRKPKRVVMEPCDALPELYVDMLNDKIADLLNDIFQAATLRFLATSARFLSRWTPNGRFF